MAVFPFHPGPSLRRWRADNRVKQQALAIELGVSQARISRWEAGLSRPDEPYRSRILTLLRARPRSAADKALAGLVASSSDPVHLVCDLTHRLLAASPRRAQDWHLPVSDLLGKPLWRFASEDIRNAEDNLEGNGWFEPLGPDILYHARRKDFAELTIMEGMVRISRLPLSDGSFARLVRTEASCVPNQGGALLA